MKEILDGLDVAKVEAIMAARMNNPGDPHAATAAEYYGVKVEDVTAEQRAKGKELNFYLYYSTPMESPKARVSRQSGFFDWDLIVIFGLIALGITLIVLMFVAADRGEKKWAAFSKEHHCVVVAKINGDVYTTTSFTAKGNVAIGTAVSSDKTGYKCDDGITYYR